MKQSALILLFLSCFLGKAQIFNPISWEFSTNDLGENTYELIFTATLDDGWSIYSQFVDEGGPIPTSFEFEESESYERIDLVTEDELNKETKHDPIFDMVVSKISKKAVFRQKVILKSNNALIKGVLSYQVCDHEKCLMPTDIPFSFEYKDGSFETASVDDFKPADLTNDEANKLLYGMLPEDISRVDGGCAREAKSLTADIKENKSLWGIFGLGFLGGLIALLTPCVFPMIPLTVSFFTKKSDHSAGGGFGKAALYGFFIVLVYLILSIPFHIMDSVNPDILNEISTNVILNIIFFLIFVFFAFSFFGYYELTLPSSWTERTTKGENVGGLLGVFFMALTLAIVSFSCTGPILGSLLAGSLTADGGAIQLSAGMVGFGLALGLPFALFAAFPQWLNSLPKSGGWLNTVKVVLGFLELALAFKFLSNADLVKQWGLLKVEVFLGIWILIFLGMALYLFGKIKFPHDSPIRKLSFLRVSTGILTIAFVVYLGSGFRLNQETGTYHSLTVLSGLAPPVGYSMLYPNDCPNNLNCFKDLKKGVEYAKSVNKPIIIDFTGYACVNCRKMEEHVWPDGRINGFLKDEYVLISLYVDDKRDLPADQQLVVEKLDGGTRTLENYGHKWAHFQTQFFQANSQPFYVLLSPDGTKILNQPVGYTPDEDTYASFLQCGLDVFGTQAENSSLDFSVN